VQYIAQSIDIIINMKEGEQTPRSSTSNLPLLSCTSLGSVSSQNLIMQSMKEAVHALNEKNQRYKEQGTNPYEKMVQKLESDVRGHIKLEHEMKIHMDYLEHKLEQF
jgi:predicted transcriptional regulator